MADYVIQPKEAAGLLKAPLPVTYSVYERRVVPYEMRCISLGIAALGKSMQEAATTLVETAASLHEALTWIPEGERRPEDQRVVRELEKYLVSV